MIWKFGKLVIWRFGDLEMWGPCLAIDIKGNFKKF